MNALLAKIRSQVSILVTAAMVVSFLATGSLAYASTTADNGSDTVAYQHDRDNDGDRDGDRDRDNDRDGRGHDWGRDRDQRSDWGHRRGHRGFDDRSHWYRWRWMNNRYERYFDRLAYCQWFASVYGYLPSPSCPIVPLTNAYNY